MLVEVGLLIIGFVVLIKGADWFVDAASSIANHMKISKIIIGLTIISFGTSAPELAVSFKSIISGNHDIVMGNVIGSNILNILLILGVCSLFRKIYIKENTLKKEIPIMILLMSLLSVLLSDSLFDSSMTNNLTRSDGIVILFFFIFFIYYIISQAKNKIFENPEIKKMSLGKSVIFTIIGIGMIIIGSDLVVDSASNIAKIMGVSEKMIGLTIIALGTSLPELVTSVVAVKKGESDLAIGNVVGSNIFNIGIVLAIPVCIFGGIDKITINYIDLSVMILSGILLWIFSLSSKNINRKEGIVFLLIFVIYYGFIILNR